MNSRRATEIKGRVRLSIQTRESEFRQDSHILVDRSQPRLFAGAVHVDRCRRKHFPADRRELSTGCRTRLGSVTMEVSVVGRQRQRDNDVNRAGHRIQNQPRPPRRDVHLRLPTRSTRRSLTRRHQTPLAPFEIIPYRPRFAVGACPRSPCCVAPWMVDSWDIQCIFSFPSANPAVMLMRRN